MPELPEVQTVVNELKQCIVGRRIIKIEEYYPNTIKERDTEWNLPIEVDDVERIGKYILIQLGNGFTLIVHLRMTGKLIFSESEYQLLKHERARIFFSDNSILSFDDVRTFGTIDYVDLNVETKYFEKLGLDPFSINFNIETLSVLFKKSKKPIKTFLLDQSKIAGLGNIYVCEVLYRVKLDPQQITDKISKSMLKKLISEIKVLMKQAIECNGTTISDYRRVDDKSGTFQNFLQVYGKETCPKKHQIKKIKIAGRSTYFCPICQKLETNHSE